MFNAVVLTLSRKILWTVATRSLKYGRPPIFFTLGTDLTEVPRPRVAVGYSVQTTTTSRCFDLLDIARGNFAKYLTIVHQDNVTGHGAPQKEVQVLPRRGHGIFVATVWISAAPALVQYVRGHLIVRVRLWGTSKAKHKPGDPWCIFIRTTKLRVDSKLRIIQVREILQSTHTVLTSSSGGLLPLAEAILAHSLGACAGKVCSTQHAATGLRETTCLGGAYPKPAEQSHAWYLKLLSSPQSAATRDKRREKCSRIQITRSGSVNHLSPQRGGSTLHVLRSQWRAQWTEKTESRSGIITESRVLYTVPGEVFWIVQGMVPVGRATAKGQSGRDIPRRSVLQSGISPGTRATREDLCSQQHQKRYTKAAAAHARPFEGFRIILPGNRHEHRGHKSTFARVVAWNGTVTRNGPHAWKPWKLPHCHGLVGTSEPSKNTSSRESDTTTDRVDPKIDAVDPSSVLIVLSRYDNRPETSACGPMISSYGSHGGKLISWYVDGWENSRVSVILNSVGLRSVPGSFKKKSQQRRM
ncbi:hypothetical protein DFH09DRAFT_1082186 [Mycena vulgaris]|nr:hypothetical protein DFH09DRAFT_1082186 [Mycena vulgaris]